MAKIPEEKMDELMKILTSGLGEVFKGFADVKCIKGNTDDIMGQMMCTYMAYPIIKCTVSRDGTDVSVDKCNIDDVIHVLPHAISSLLGLVPAKYRNDILYKAVNEEMSEDGGLLERIKEKENEEEDDE